MAHLVICLAYNNNPNVSLDGIVETTREATMNACATDPNIVYLLVAGSKHLLRNVRGIDRPDWEHFWSEGEHVFGKIIEGIGIQRFSPMAQPRIHAHLLDINTEQKDEEKKYNPEEKSWTEGDLRQVPSLILSLLRREQCSKVSCITIILPDLSQQVFVENVISQAFQTQDFLRDVSLIFL
mmetsp:Transcript_31141/g.29988  ORF Transcript_31141/g.29988 Transcript_31141/m.29988 type:complete len:181 (-) Transcript_31141:248-790(-)|eukprot:CAMPEP_0197836110 /NCGR_PEP_ID=MMETSP1437-20131217/27970_1 /TAXON_ID=49252 ORGANISM="Eucampia antarctica, Strain CCMP1452" /NCGR_SAMPLE_ID=MMETSP1437 /ASSEMBLY_ACC=CAM_ASM_001096 /LENGTH=180 /DNA_ID=CAMNT_0043442025 /DNA_START=126 /DNA_END=668 /DNA_ORIENTATION=+